MKKLVIIDDEYFFRQALIKYIGNFKDEFIVVGDAGNGKLGIALIEQYQPEIILIDISMPQMTGFDVISYIQERKISARFIIISGYDKFEYAQKAIQMGVQDFLLKPVTVESLYKSLKQTSERIDREVKKVQNLEVLDRKKRRYQNYIKHFAASQFVRKDKDREEMQKLAVEAGYQLDAQWHVAILYRVNHLPGTWEKTEYELYYFMVENVLCELLGEEACCISYINFQKSLCFLVGVYALYSDAEWLRVLLQKTIEICDPEGSLGTTAVIGGFYTEADQLYDSYIEAFAMERKWSFYERFGVFFIEDADDGKQENRYLQQNEEFIQRLIAAMRQNQRSLMKEILRTFVNSLALIQPPREQFLLQINQVLSALLAFGMEYGVAEAIGKNNKLFSGDYMEISSVSEIQEELVRYGEHILQQVHISKCSASSVIVRRTKEYVKTHYADEELCLEVIADTLGVNLQYMCFLFKKQTDMTIGNYILQTRMEMAGKLFQRTSCNVSEVARKVGFLDVSYFSKCFKKYFGVSPKQYQNVSGNYTKII